MPESGFLDELAWRGMLHQTTDDDGLPSFLSTPGRIAYCGFDPTGSSLTIGNFVAIKLLATGCLRFMESGRKKKKKAKAAEPPEQVDGDGGEKKED